MKNKVAEMLGIMIKNKEAEEFFKNGWLALYNDLLDNPIRAMKAGENGEYINKVCAFALADWYESQTIA